MNPLNCRIRHALRFGVYHIHWRLGPCTPSITVEKYTPPICFGRTASATRFCRRSSNVQRMMKKLQSWWEKELAKTMLDTLIYWGLSENSGEFCPFRGAKTCSQHQIDHRDIRHYPSRRWGTFVIFPLNHIHSHPPFKFDLDTMDLWLDHIGSVILIDFGGPQMPWEGISRPLPSQYLWQSPKISAIFSDWVAPPTMMELHYRHFAGNLHFKKSVHMCFSDQILRFPDKNIPSMQFWDWWFIQYLFALFNGHIQ